MRRAAAWMAAALLFMGGCHATVEKTAVDLDLTQLSSVVVYAEVYNMIVAPEEYLGKVVRIQGEYYPAEGMDTGKVYHYVVIADATACCQQGLEVVLDGEHGPEDYPQAGTAVMVTGVFSQYEENGRMYSCLIAPEFQEGK